MPKKKKSYKSEHNDRNQECRLTNTSGHGFPPRLAVIRQFPCAVVTEQVDTASHLSLVASVAGHSAATVREREERK